jgi:hypothetical protein
MGVLSFVSGFSERLFRDMIDKTEDVFGHDNQARESNEEVKQLLVRL